MADKYMIGINNLRKLSRDVNTSPLWMCLRLEREGDWGSRSNAIRLPNVLRELADQIEREHAEELAAAKRDLTDEAREAVERLRAVSHDEILRSANPEHEIVDELCKAVGVVRQPTYTGTFDAISDRLIELIEHGGKRDVDVAALRELADDMDKRAHGAYGKTFVNASMYAGLMHGLSKRIRKAVEGATVPDAESEAERACAALLEWRDQVAGMLGIDCGSMADEVQDAIMDELDERLMPPGMAWPRFEDSERVEFGSAAGGLDGPCEKFVFTRSMGGVCQLQDAGGSMANAFRSERVNRPEPEVLGADGEPIKAGETVWDSTSPNDPTSSTVWRHGGPLKVLRRNDVRAGFVICENDQGIPLDCCAADLTHAAPDTQERIDEDKRKEYDAYWGCDTNITCSDCPAVIDGMKPYEYYGVLNCRVAQGMDIARRKHELDAKTTGGAR